jgi:hypothetical protein
MKNPLKQNTQVIAVPDIAQMMMLFIYYNMKDVVVGGRECWVNIGSIVTRLWTE